MSRGGESSAAHQAAPDSEYPTRGAVSVTFQAEGTFRREGPGGAVFAARERAASAGRPVSSTSLRRVREAVEAGDASLAAERLKDATVQLDTAAKKHIIHQNEASRRKSRLAASVNGIAKS